MGTLTCSVMLGFLVLHVGVILMILATGTPEWLTASQNETDHNSTYDNTTYPKITKGLWKICVGDNCTRLHQHEQESWFRAVQGLDLASLGLGLLALIVTYAVLLTERCKNSAPAAVFNTGTQLLAAAGAITAVIIFGMKAKKHVLSDEFPVEYIVDFFWSYYTYVAGVVCLGVSAILSMPSAQHYRTRQSGYESI